MASKWKTWKDVPIGERNSLAAYADLWEQTVGYKVVLTTKQLLALANLGASTQADIGKYMATQKNAAAVLKTMPWAAYGLGKDEYAATSTQFGTTYKEVTGKDISAAGLASAFKNPRDPTGGLLTAQEYKQQLMNDTSLQNTFGWIKYGMDFAAWTQQKLQLRSAYGRDVSDTEASTILQYNKAATGPNMTAIARGAQPQGVPASAGVGGSVAR